MAQTDEANRPTSGVRVSCASREGSPSLRASCRRRAAQRCRCQRPRSSRRSSAAEPRRSEPHRDHRTPLLLPRSTRGQLRTGVVRDGDGGQRGTCAPHGDGRIRSNHALLGRLAFRFFTSLEHVSHRRAHSNIRLQLTACWLRARRCRALAARTAADEANVVQKRGGASTRGVMISSQRPLTRHARVSLREPWRLGQLWIA